MAPRPTRPSAKPFEHAPMLAEAGKLPTNDDGWAYEMKWDGVRASVEVTPAGVRIMSRLGNDVTARYPELQALADALAPVRAVLDGEIVALDESGRPSFGKLQNRMHADARKALQFAASMPVVLMLFDVLEVDGNDVTALALRRTSRGAGAPRARGTELADTTHDRRPRPGGPRHRAHPRAGRRRRQTAGLAVHAGRRSSVWRKVKITAQQELVVGGWIPGEGRLDTTVGALIVGYHDGPGGPLRYAGRVGSGLDDATPRPVPAHVARAGRLPLRSAASHGGPTDRAMGRAGRRGRGAVHDVDHRRRAPQPRVPRRTRRQTRGRRRPRADDMT